MQVGVADIRSFVTDNGWVGLVRVTKAAGSAPREKGAWMLVAEHTILGTIGGGVLEWEAIKKTRELLCSADQETATVNLVLGPESGQCCGGQVDYSIEILDHHSIEKLCSAVQHERNNDPNVYVFGAGHVGRALCHALAPLPFNVHMIDSRSRLLQEIPEGALIHHQAVEESVVELAPPASLFVVMTHDHGLDFLVTNAALLREDALFVGLIGSKTKRKRFEKHHLANNGTKIQLSNLRCPIGPGSLSDKRPSVIAAYTASELLNHIA